MKNVMTKGSLGIRQDESDITSLSIPINEDFSMLVRITEIFETHLVGEKIFDESAQKKKFNAIVKFNGFLGTPDTKNVQIGAITVFHRVGDFNSPGSNGFELHEENVDKSSFVCFLENPLLKIIDNGNSTGTPVKYTLGAWVKFGETLNLEAHDNVNNYYSTEFDSVLGRIYIGHRVHNVPNPKYLVYIQGFGSSVKTFSSTAGGITFSLEVDTQGKVIDFTAV